jgi:hypothetical protein
MASDLQEDEEAKDASVQAIPADVWKVVQVCQGFTIEDEGTRLQGAKVVVDEKGLVEIGKRRVLEVWIAWS